MIKLKNNKSKLTITIFDDSEQDPYEHQFESIKKQANIVLDNPFSEYIIKNINLNDFNHHNNFALNCLINYMEGKNTEHDISYVWLNNLGSVSSISKSIIFSPTSWNNFISSKKFEEEFKVRYSFKK